MRSRLPKTYTVLIAGTGKAPFTLTFQPLPVLITLLVLVSLPIAWMSFLLYNNVRLAQRNQALTETASEVLTELDSLDAEIKDLKQRAGMSSEQSQFRGRRDEREQSALPQGGPATVVEAETLFTLAKRQMPHLNLTLDARVKPALEATLLEEAEREAAFPDGKPLAGEVEISSEFGLRRNPFGASNYEMHEGLDFKGPIGTPIYATAEGVVVKAQSGSGYGKHVVLDHGFGYETLYAHMSELTVEAGEKVDRGELVGYLGNTGRSSGPHLHYGIYRDNQPVNPRYYLKLEDSEE